MLRHHRSILNLRQKRSSVPQLNTTSTADISFMLLIFFLVTTSMDTDKGLTRQLPPPNPMEQLPEESKVKEGMVMRLDIDGQNRLTCDDDPMSLAALRHRAVEFVRRKGRDHIIQLHADRLSSYDVYFQVQNELVAAYRELREAEAKRRYRHSLSELNENQQMEIRQLIPQRIAEVYAVNGQKGGQP